MVTVTKTGPATINVDRLLEELATLTIPPAGFGIAGYHRLDDRRYEANTAPTVIGQRSENGVVTEDIAQPGELRFRYAVALSAPQDAALVGALAAHNATQTSGEQQRQDLDEQEITGLLQDFQDLASAPFALLNNAQRFELLRRVLRRQIRLEIRRSRTAAV